MRNKEAPKSLYLEAREESELAAGHFMIRVFEMLGSDKEITRAQYEDLRQDFDRCRLLALSEGVHLGFAQGQYFPIHQSDAAVVVNGFALRFVGLRTSEVLASYRTVSQSDHGQP